MKRKKRLRVGLSMGIGRASAVEGGMVRRVFEVSSLKWLQGKFLDAHAELYRIRLKFCIKYF